MLETLNPLQIVRFCEAQQEHTYDPVDATDLLSMYLMMCFTDSEKSMYPLEDGNFISHYGINTYIIWG
jgi:hypothetical protein